MGGRDDLHIGVRTGGGFVYDLTSAEETYDALEIQANAPKGLSGGAIAGIVIACVVFVCGLCVLVLFLLKKKQDKEGARPAPVYVADDEPKDDQTDEPQE